MEACPLATRKTRAHTLSGTPTTASRKIKQARRLFDQPAAQFGLFVVAFCTIDHVR